MNYKTKILIMLSTYMCLQEQDKNTKPITENMYRYKAEIDLLKVLLGKRKIDWKQQLDYVINLFAVKNTINSSEIKKELMRDYNFDIEAVEKNKLWLEGEE